MFKCPICDKFAYHYLINLLGHIYSNHLPSNMNGPEYKTCLCGRRPGMFGDFHVHIMHSHNGEVDWMYDAYHAMMLGANPNV